MQPRLVLNVLQNPRNLLVAKQKVAKEASPPKAKDTDKGKKGKS